MSGRRFEPALIALLAFSVLWCASCEGSGSVDEIAQPPLDVRESTADAPCDEWLNPGSLARLGRYGLVVGSEVVLIEGCIEAQASLYITSAKDTYSSGATNVTYCNRCEEDVFFLGYGDRFVSGALTLASDDISFTANCGGLVPFNEFVVTPELLDAAALATRVPPGHALTTFGLNWHLAFTGPTLHATQRSPAPWFSGDTGAYLQREIELACVDAGLVDADAPYLSLSVRPRAPGEGEHQVTLTFPPIDAEQMREQVGSP